MDDSSEAGVSIQGRVEELEAQMAAVLERNKRVELDKAWEQSWTRIGLVVLLTYLLMCLVFYMIGIQRFAANAVIPTFGYYLSTRSLPLFKRLWIKQIEEG